jgi:membrane protease subunit HflC
MHHALRTFFWLLILILILVLYASMYTVNEGQKALLLRLGEIVTNPNGSAKIILPGLHFKLPILNQVRKFDVRLQTLMVQSSRILTQEQKYVLVDYYIKWQVENLQLYYQRTGGDSLQAQTLLQQQVNDALRAAFGQRTITDMVSGERVNVMALLKESANRTAKNLGIWVADVRIKSIDLPKEVSETVFSRMRTKREQVATQHRADGKAQAEGVRAAADAKATIIVAEAQTKAASLRAQGMAEASHIFTAAYSQDPKFYAFYRSLEAYKEAFSSKSDLLILTPESAFFSFFNQPLGKPNVNTPSETGNG